MKRRQNRPADTVIVLDFETSGLSPGMGDRVIEVGAVRLEAGRITGHFQSLMNPGNRVSEFIEDSPALPIACCAQRHPAEP